MSVAKKSKGSVKRGKDRDRGYTDQQYDAVARSAQLVKIVLIGSELKVDPGYYDQSEENRKFLIDGNAEQPNYDKDDGLASTFYVWKVEARDGNRKPLKIRAQYFIIYEGFPDQNEAAVKGFLRRVGRVSTYAYFRAHVSHLSGAANARLPQLPVITA